MNFKNEEGLNKNWYEIKGLMIASMEKNISPEQWVGLCKSLGYSVTRNKEPAEPTDKDKLIQQLREQLKGIH